MNYEYDIAISFAGENRKYASDLANILEKHSVRVFYDDFEQANLWGKNLYDHFSEIYSKKSKFCVMFLSKDYAVKAWTTLERQNAQARAFKENKEYILPIKIDDTEIPGIPTTIGYLDLRKISIDEIAILLLKKLGIKKVEVVEDDDDLILPNIKKEFSDLEKDKFLKASFDIIKNYFNKASKNLETKIEGVRTEFDDITKYKFVTKVYLNGKLINQCKIWIGGMMSGNSISYSEGQFDIHQDTSLNDSLTIKTDEKSIYLVPLGTSFFSNINIPEKASPQDASKYLWQRFINPLSY